MDRLQVKEFEIFKRTGDVDADRLIASKTAMLVNEPVSEFVSSEQYQSLTNDQKRLVLKKLLGEVNTEARNAAMQENPRLFLESKIKESLSKDELRVLEEAGVQFPERKAEGGLITPGNIDVSKRPAVRNPDGSVSTVRSMSINVDGKEVLIPTVVNGRVVSDQEAIKHYRQTGQHLGMFDSPAAATAYAQRLHEQEAQRVKKARGGYTPAEEVLLRRYSSR